MRKTNDVLYVSYDGMTDALGESQVLSYLIGLAEFGHRINLISFEKKDAFENKGARIRELCLQAKINWIPLSYTSRPPVLSTLFDIYKLSKAAAPFRSAGIIHCRGYITALLGLSFKRKRGTSFIFDMRGFWADEKKESGHWSGPHYRPIYNFFKKKEAAFFREADVVISLTEAGKKEIVSLARIPESKVRTIPTCVNQKIFTAFDQKTKETLRTELGVSSSTKVFLYSGSLGGSYDISILIRAFETFRKTYPDSKLLVLTKTLEEAFPSMSTEVSSNLIIRSVAYHQVASYLMAADLGFVFYSLGFSTIGRYPTKLSEYWSCGLPALVYNKIGDTKELLDKHPEYGYYYFDQDELAAKTKEFDLNIDKVGMRALASREFSLEKGIAFYDEVYKSLS